MSQYIRQMVQQCIVRAAPRGIENPITLKEVKKMSFSNNRRAASGTEPDWDELERVYSSDQVSALRAYRKRGSRALRIIPSAEGFPISADRARHLRPAP
jgi:hypothetical protein